VVQGPAVGPRRLDGHIVGRITAFLFHEGGNEDPAQLTANVGQQFSGAKIYGSGFTFDDSESKGLASSLSVMRRVLSDNPRGRDAVYPYLGGEEINDSPTHSHRRYVINFGDRDEDECRQLWPELMAIVEERVKPERMKLKDGPAKSFWWRFERPRLELSRALAGLSRVLATTRHSPHSSFAFLSASAVFSDALVVFPLSTHAAFCALQSRPHEVWARFFGSSMKDDLRYTPSDCFETFPFPEDWTGRADLEEPGRAYYDFRAKLMVDNDEGLTRTYNRFHHPEESDPRIAELRELHAAMDRAVLQAYGWDDIDTTCEVLLDHEDDEEESTRRRKPWRYRWPDEVRDDVLARLLKLNAERAAAEEQSGAAADTSARKRKRSQAAKQSEALL
jgi:MmeI, target recognition domain